jgi:peptidoglycan/LPS O-acetylase OafA/YrhL
MWAYLEMPHRNLANRPPDISSGELYTVSGNFDAREEPGFFCSQRAPVTTRIPFLDFLRALASHLIVFHHLAFYGPLSDLAFAAAPLLIGWLADDARMAVQMFFVLGGFFTARHLDHSAPFTWKKVVSTLWSRYRRVGFPYIVTLAIAVAANALARRWMVHDAISAPPSIDQLLAHVLFLQDLLGYETLTAGIWYLAIDFQLYLLCTIAYFVVSSALRRRTTTVSPEVMRRLVLWLSPLAIASLFWFNRHPRFDTFAIYFFGSYFLGMLLNEILEARVSLSWGIAYFSLVVLAAWLYWRPRLLVAAITAVFMYLAARRGESFRWFRNRVASYLGRISFSLYLIHFPVLLLVNAWFFRNLALSPHMAIWALILAYLLSLVASSGFYYGIERRRTDNTATDAHS